MNLFEPSSVKERVFDLLFLTEKQLKKKINQIKTNLLEPGDPKDPTTSTVFQI